MTPRTLRSRIPDLLLVAYLAAMLPLFVRMPLWVDATFYDVAARNILCGGTHYRDVFDTNLPGMIWMQAAVRGLFGFSSEVLRIADLVVLALTLFVAGRILRDAEVPPAMRGWFRLGWCAFYLGETEFVHTQRDIWMLLPILLAVRVRQLHAVRPRPVLEGFLWGLAVWIKPHSLVVALAVWLATGRTGSLRKLVAGGLIAGALGAVGSVSTRAWGPMWDVLLHWNGGYLSWTLDELIGRARNLASGFGPWGLLHLAAIPIAVRRMQADEPGGKLLAGLYFGWLVQTMLLQRAYPYVSASALLPAMLVLARTRWIVGVLAVSVVGAMVHLWVGNVPLLPDRELVNIQRLKYWNRCFQGPIDAEFRDDLSWYRDNPSCPGWGDLERTAAYLETLDLKDGDLLCWCDSTHPLYLRLELEPGWRFMHPMTMLSMPGLRDRMRAELGASRSKYIVADSLLEPTNALDYFPWNQPCVRRLGRFSVHEWTRPIGENIAPPPPTR